MVSISIRSRIKEHIMLDFVASRLDGEGGHEWYLRQRFLRESVFYGDPFSDIPQSQTSMTIIRAAPFFTGICFLRGSLCKEKYAAVWTAPMNHTILDQGWGAWDANAMHAHLLSLRRLPNFDSKELQDNSKHWAWGAFQARALDHGPYT